MAPIYRIARRERAVSVDREERGGPHPPDGFGAIAFESGSLTDLLRSGRLPDAGTVSDPLGYASGAFRWDLDLRPGDTREVWLAVPFEPAAESVGLPGEDAASAAARLGETVRFWRKRLARIRIQVPDAGAKLVQILQTTVAYIFVNRSGPAIQPGARDYARSWIRDGALTSAALLEMGYPDEVRDFLRWYARYQYDDGRIPCCVDARGPDPVAEHDSNGEFIYAIMNYYRHTGDRAFLEEMWPQVVKAVAYIRFLREQTMTPEFESPEALPVYGLAPKSISHEGYSAHPVHSYWDDFFLLRGLKDAVTIARELGDEEHVESFTALRDEPPGRPLRVSLAGHRETRDRLHSRLRRARRLRPNLDLDRHLARRRASEPPAEGAGAHLRALLRLLPRAPEWRDRVAVVHALRAAQRRRP